MSTLQLDSALLQEAERQARLRNVDLNELVADFIRRFIGKEGKTTEELMKEASTW